MAQHMHFEGNTYQDCTISNTQQIATAMPRDPPSLHAFPELRETIVGREEDVKELRKLFNDSRFVLITGIGGLGKTTVATLCANEWVQQNEFKYAVFVNMENDTSAKTEYRALSEHLFHKRNYSENMVKEVYQYYNKNKSLFILDNIEANGLLPTYLPPKDFQNIYVLGTSQFKEVQKDIKLYPLRKLTETASFDLIKQIFTDNDIRIDAEITKRVKIIIQKLDNHPMALQHAAAFITNMVRLEGNTPLESLDEYINQFNQQLQEPPPENLPSIYRISVLTSIELNIRKATKNDDVRTLLFCMAYLDPSRIDITMFHNHTKFNKHNIKKFSRDLKKYSIITEHKHKLNVISMHRLIPIVCHELIKEYTETDYISILFYIFFSYEDCTYTKNSLKNHFSSLIQHLKIPQNILSNLYIESFRNHDKIRNQLNERLKLISCGISDIEDWTVLHYCVFAGHRTLFEYFKTTVEQDENLCINLYSVQIVKNSTFLLFDSVHQHALDIRYQKNKRFFKGLGLLHLYAAYGVDVKDFYDLLEFGYDMNESDNNGIMTPILWAAKNMVHDLVYILLDKGAKYDLQFKDLLSAAASGDRELVLTLLRTSNVNFATSVFGKMLLWWGANHVILTQELIERGADVTGADPYGNTLLHLAAQHGNYNLATKLISAGVNVDAVSASGETPLLEAVKTGSSKIAIELIRAGAIVDVENIFGETPLLLAARKGQSDITTELIQASANIHAVGAFGETPLLMAIKNVNIESVDTTGKTHLLMARKGCSDIAFKLIHSGANIESAGTTGETPLLLAARKGCFDIAAELIRLGANIEAVDASGNTPLLAAASTGYGDIVTKLIGINANVEAMNSYGRTPLLEAVRNCHIDVVTKLILAGANVNVVDGSGEAPSLVAMRKGLSNIATELIKANANVNVIDGSGETPLLFATKMRSCLMATIMIHAGANVDAVCFEGKSPLLLAAENGYSDIATELIRAGANLEFKAYWSTPLLKAVEYGYSKIVTELIQAGANLESVGICGRTALFIATMHGHSDIAIKLICAGANVNTVDKSGKTPLYWARRKGDLILEEVLIEHGATNGSG